MYIKDKDNTVAEATNCLDIPQAADRLKYIMIFNDDVTHTKFVFVSKKFFSDYVFLIPWSTIVMTLSNYLLLTSTRITFHYLKHVRLLQKGNKMSHSYVGSLFPLPVLPQQ